MGMTLAAWESLKAKGTNAGSADRRDIKPKIAGIAMLAVSRVISPRIVRTKAKVGARLLRAKEKVAKEEKERIGGRDSFHFHLKEKAN